MESIKKVKLSARGILLLLIWAVEYVTNIWYTKNYFLALGVNSDYAGDAVLAKHLADTGKFILSEDWYPTTEVYVIHHQLIMTPLFRLFSDYSTAWIGTSIVAFFIMSLSVYYFAKALNQSNVRALLAVTLFMNPIIAFQMTFSVWFHGYLFYYVLAFIVLGMLFRNYNSQRPIKITDIVLVAMVSFLTGLCGIRMFMIVYIPLFVACFVDIYNEDISKIWNAFSKLIVLSLVSALIGFSVYFLLISPKYGNGSVVGIGITLYDSEMIRENINTLPQTLIDGLSINFSKTSNYFYAAMIAILAMLWVVVFINNIGLLVDGGCAKNLQFTSLFSLCCMIVNLIFLVVTQPNNEMITRYRYFAVSTYALLPLFAVSVQLDTLKKVKELFNLIVIVASFLAICCFQANAISDYGSEAVSWRKPYIDYLVENGYTFGYATYWNADVSIMMSNGKVQFAPIHEDDFSIFKWNTRKSFENKKPEFVLLTNEEYENRIIQTDMEEKIVYRDDKVVIYVSADKSRQ